jgi:hypothetical protein
MVAVTTSVTLAIYAVQNGNAMGWASAQTMGYLTSAVVLLGALLLIEARVPTPLIPLDNFRLRNFAVANVVNALWTAGACAWYYMGALYMQLVLGYSPMRVATAFLPASLLTATLCLGVSAALVTRLGIRVQLGIGLLAGALGLALFARVPIDASVMLDVTPGMVLLGIGGGIAFNPMLLAAMRDVAPGETGLASGLLNTVSVLAGAFGLAILAGISSARTDDLLAIGASSRDALAGGFRLGLLYGAACAGAAAIVGVAFLRIESREPVT